jgi:hypothetical protein
MLFPKKPPDQQGKEEESEGILRYLYSKEDIDTFNEKVQIFKLEALKREREKTKKNLLEINVRIPQRMI